MVYFIVLQSISQASRGKIRPTAETIAAEREPSVWQVQFDNMGAERKKPPLPGASQLMAALRSQCVPGVTSQ